MNMRPQQARRTRQGTKPRVGLRKAWRRASVRKRIRMVAIAVITAICALALIAALVRIAIWQAEVKTAQIRQSELSTQYNFDPGNIISDGQFFNPDAMSKAEVQAFLNDHGGMCSGSQCLKAKTFDTQTQPADAQCRQYTGAKGETAADIIDKSARACGISQKVLLTVLQKEQHLVSASNPTDFQFKAAMGLSCPDNADCDPNYAGFFKQVYGAANRYRYYLAHESQYGYHAGALNYVGYNPDASCGGTNVYINNKATALLYIYTPYQPNVAALKAGAGNGDTCSSYGNRNFSIIYEGWFGNPRS